MTKEKFEVLKLEHSQSGKTLKDFLKEKGINYGTYHYWLKKKENEESTGELVPIHFTEEKKEQTAHLWTSGIRECRCCFRTVCRHISVRVLRVC